ncbi:MAG: glycosyl hydrolase 115 family protein [Thermoguttaceae bacterium]
MTKTLPIRFLMFFFLAFGYLQAGEIVSQGTDLIVQSQQTPGAFPLVQDGQSAQIVFDANDAAVVKTVAQALAKDIALVTGTKPGIWENGEKLPKLAIIIGSMDKSSLIKAMCKAKKLPADRLQGKWETFLITIVEHPLENVDRALVIAGSDPRGTAFGTFELSKKIGVSPWYWWADVLPEKHESLFVESGAIVDGPPSVKYRGIFLNDEDWGLKPWAAANMDPDIKDIGPKTYARIFELLLRLKANFIWPAMHSCTKAFYYYKDNPKVADQYAIVVGSSHCEPMLRNNVDEWTNNFQAEYGKPPGPWRYDTNKDEIYRYWDDRAKESAKYESVYTVGVRGIHDSGMPGPKDENQKIALLDKVIADQREILAARLKKPIDEIPQIFCPYKEVLLLYQKGLDLPDDVTIVWADDNHGYIRQLSTPKEQLRAGKSGVYYHLSYYGAPSDYLWLSSISPELISFEMTKAYEYGATRLWVFNVGDLKPAEAEIEFAMDLAWNVSKWPPEKAHLYTKDWAARTFGPEFAQQIADIKQNYYLLAQTGKPEHLDLISFSRAEAQQRLEAYQHIGKEALELGQKMPDRLKDAYFQLVLYPTLGACRMNEKFIYAAMSVSPKPGDTNTPDYYAEKARAAYSEIQRLTRVYNTEIAGGKWNKMMDWKPRNRPVFRMPAVGPSTEKKEVFKPDSPLAVIDAANYAKIGEGTSAKLQLIKDLGASGTSITMLPFTSPSISDENAEQAPFAEYEVELPAGQRSVEVICTPTEKIHAGRGLRYALYFGNETATIVDVNSAAETPPWEKNVLRGYSIGKSTHKLDTGGTIKIRIAPLDPGLLISQIKIY